MLKKFCGATFFVLATFAAASVLPAAPGGGGGRGGSGGGGGGGFSGGGISAGGRGSVSAPAISGGGRGSVAVPSISGGRSFSNSGNALNSTAGSLNTPNSSAAVRANTGVNANAITPNVNRSLDGNRNFARDNNFNRDSNFNRSLNNSVANGNNWEHRNGWSNDWGRNWNRDWDRRGWGSNWYYPFAFYPFWYSGGYGYGYPYYSYDYGYDYPVEVTAVVPDNTYAAVDANSTRPSDAMSNGQQFYGQAIKAFASGNYKEAVRLAGHAAVDAPRSEKVHELMSLSLFAMGDFRSAAAEAHAATTLGPVADWSALKSYYNDSATYKTQLDALKTAAKKEDATPDTHFLLGYHYMMQGYYNHAHDQFARVVEMAPKDDVAKHLMEDAGKTTGGLDARQ